MNPDIERSTTKQRRPDWAALAIAALLAAIGVTILIDVAPLRDAAGYSQVGPATIPIWIAFALFGLAVWTGIAAFRGDFPEREHQQLPPVLWVVGGLVVQMLLIRTAGFSIATGVLFGLAARGFGARRLWLTIPIGIVLCFGVWWLFAIVLQLSLPAGPLENLIR